MWKQLGHTDLFLDLVLFQTLEEHFMFHPFIEILFQFQDFYPHGFSINFVGTSFHLLKDNIVVGDGILDDELFRLYLNPSLNYILTTMHGNVGIKRGVINVKFFILQHRRLGHISIERIKRLINDRVLEALDYTDFDTCVDYIKGKQTNKIKKDTGRSSGILKIVYVDNSSPYDLCLNSQRYFITFIDDYSRYM